MKPILQSTCYSGKYVLAINYYIYHDSLTGHNIYQYHYWLHVIPCITQGTARNESPYIIQEICFSVPTDSD